MLAQINADANTSWMKICQARRSARRSKYLEFLQQTGKKLAALCVFGIFF